MSDDGDQDPDDQGVEEEEEQSEHDDASENESPDEPEEEKEEAPPEKEWTESFMFFAAFSEDEVVKVKVGESLTLPKWATEALSDSPYWMQQSIEKLKQSDEPLNINIPLTIEAGGSGYFELREQRAEEACEQEKEQPTEEEEEGQQEKEEVAEEQEPPNPEINIDLLTIITEVSPECAGYLMSLEGVSLRGVVEWCGTTLSLNKAYNSSFLSAVAQARALKPDMPLRIDFDTLFEREDKTDASYSLYNNVLQEWLSAGLTPDHIPSPEWINNHRDVHLLRKMLMSLPPDAVEHLSVVPEPAGDDVEAAPQQRAFLPKYFCQGIAALRQLLDMNFPKALKITCQTTPEVEGVYVRRGTCGDRPRYWYSDAVTSKVAYDITFSSLYGWRLSVVGGEALYSCGVSGTDLLPMMPNRWIHKNQDLDDKSEHLFITPLDIHNIVPKNKFLEASATEDPILASSYTKRQSPPYQLRLYFSDLLLLMLAEYVKLGLVSQFRKLLKFKTTKARHVGEPVGFYHLLLSSAPRITDESTLLTIFDLAPAVVKPLGLVELRPFLIEMLSSDLLSDTQLKYLQGHIYQHVLEVEGTVDGKMSENTMSISSFVMQAREFKEQYDAACELLKQNPPSIVKDLQHLAAVVPIRWDSHFMYQAVVSNCVTVVEWLLDSGRPAECQETHHQEPVPLMPVVIEKKLTDMVRMLISRGHRLTNYWYKGKELGPKYIESEYSPSDANAILTAWNDKERLLAIDPEARFGLVRRVC